MVAFGGAIFQAIQKSLFEQFNIQACHANELYETACQWGFRLTNSPRFIRKEPKIIKLPGGGTAPSETNCVYVYDAYVEVFAEYCCDGVGGASEAFDKLSECNSPDRSSVETSNGKNFVVFDIGQITIKIDKACDPEYNVTQVDIECVEFTQGD